jgi:Secretion system C-terminal sorting domain
MKIYSSIFKVILLLISIKITVVAQNTSEFRVKYMVTHDIAKNQFTAWVVPEYNTPNYNNGDSEEKGATAQFTIKVPQNFVISQVQDLKGSWDKNPIKVNEQSTGRFVTKFKKEVQLVNPATEYAYYVLGKSPAETNYGKFVENEPVALFNFKGSGGNLSEVSALTKNDPFVKIADEIMSLNVGSSFYSRSGQRPTVHATPMEQFNEPTSLQTVLDKTARKVGINTENATEIEANQKAIAYPNPTGSTITVKYFSQQAGANLKLEVIDLKGVAHINQSATTKLGFNLININVSKLESGSYIIKSVEGNQISTNKFVKMQE